MRVATGDIPGVEGVEGVMRVVAGLSWGLNANEGDMLDVGYLDGGTPWEIEADGVAVGRGVPWPTCKPNCNPEFEAAAFEEVETEVGGIPALRWDMADEGVPPEPEASPSELLVIVVLLPPDPLLKRCMLSGSILAGRLNSSSGDRSPRCEDPGPSRRSRSPPRAAA